MSITPYIPPSPPAADADMADHRDYASALLPALMADQEAARNDRAWADAASLAAHRGALEKLREREVANAEEHARRQSVALEQQAANGKLMADTDAALARVRMISDIAVRRLDDRTGTTAAANVPRAVAEAFAIVDEVERVLAGKGPVLPPRFPPIEAMPE